MDGATEIEPVTGLSEIRAESATPDSPEIYRLVDELIEWIANDPARAEEVAAQLPRAGRLTARNIPRVPGKR